MRISPIMHSMTATTPIWAIFWAVIEGALQRWGYEVGWQAAEAGENDPPIGEDLVWRVLAIANEDELLNDFDQQFNSKLFYVGGGKFLYGSERKDKRKILPTMRAELRHELEALRHMSPILLEGLGIHAREGFVDWHMEYGEE